ncbi:MAG: putative quinol monooxygenase [Fuerstiella sp.]
MVVVVATIHCRPGCRESFLNEFRQIVPTVLREEGCVSYGPTIDAETDIDNQHRNADRITIVEQWTSVEALKAHLVAPHMQSYRPKVKDFVESSELRVLSPT